MFIGLHTPTQAGPEIGSMIPWYLYENVTVERIVLAYGFTDLLVEVTYCNSQF